MIVLSFALQSGVGFEEALQEKEMVLWWIEEGSLTKERGEEGQRDKLDDVSSDSMRESCLAF